jgi:hypothetical protein
MAMTYPIARPTARNFGGFDVVVVRLAQMDLMAMIPNSLNQLTEPNIQFQ